MTEKMTKKNKSAQQMAELFPDVTPLTQDKVAIQQRTLQNVSYARQQAQAESKQAHAAFHFSDGFEAAFSKNGVISWRLPDVPSDVVKQLKRGYFSPDYTLDLHGLTRAQAQNEIIALLNHAERHEAHVVSIMHGYGSGVLKQAVPNWLIQHPYVIALHQAPKMWGGSAALLVLLKTYRQYID